MKAGAYYQLAYAFDKSNKPDSALHFAQLANAIYLKYPGSELLEFKFTVIANAYIQLGNQKLADGYYRNSIDTDEPSQSYGDAWSAGQYSPYLLRQHKLTEARCYGTLGLNAAIYCPTYRLP